MQQANISLGELEQVKAYLYQQYQDQSEQISNFTLLLSDPTSDQAMAETIKEDDMEKRCAESLYGYNNLLKLTQYFNDLNHRLNECLRANGIHLIQPAQPEEAALDLPSVDR